MEKINLIFTRDFDQWVQNIIRDSLVVDAPIIWGRGLSDQIVYFDGVTFHWYRYQKDMEKLKRFLITKPLSSDIFSIDKQKIFLKIVADLRDIVSLPISRIKDNQEHLATLTQLFEVMYPYYPLGIFIAGPWRDDFLKIHGRNGQKVIDLLLHSREKSEGLLKIVGLHLRAWLGPLLEKQKYPKEYVRLLTVKEIKNFINHQKLPTKNILAKRSRGYVYINGRIVIIDNFNKFLTRHQLVIANLEAISNNNFVSGVVAYQGNLVRGRVKKIYNSFGVKAVKTGEILVTPMTSPEYLPAMKKARAIITDEGGLTCHAAIVARELKKPCIIGTKIATKVLKDGDLVEIDSKSGIVKILKKA